MKFTLLSPGRNRRHKTYNNVKSIIYQKLKNFVLFLLVFQFFFTLLWMVFGSNKEEQHITLQKSDVLQNTHTFIHSTYYYPQSKSLGPNAVAIVTTMNKRTVANILDYTIKIVGSNETMRVTKKATLTTEHLIDDRCDYSLILIQTNLIDNTGLIEIESEGAFIKLPIKKHKEIAPQSVVFCVAPQFVAEQWQTFLVQVHIAKRYGAHLHIYIVSMIESYFKLLKEYEKLGLISIEPWLTIKFPITDGPYLEPNRNVELRNQAASHTDCILMYKESTSFIGIIDMDDIFIPRHANSYYEEFEREYHGDYIVSALQYRKYDYKTIKVTSLKDQSISAIIRNSERLLTLDQGKSFVRPERYNSSWSHFSRTSDNHPIYFKELQEPVEMRLRPMKNNGMYHLKTMEIRTIDELNLNAPIPPLAVNPQEFLIDEDQLEEIEQDLKQTISLPSIAELEPLLPKEEFYMDIVFKCYNDSFYHLRDAKLLHHYMYCVNAFSCELPQRADLPCVHSDASYHSGPKMWPITFHYATDPIFTNEIGCYQ